MVKGLVSIIIPSRNEPYTYKTVKDILVKSRGDIEVIVCLDGWWPEPDEIIQDPRVRYIHYSKSKGMRNAINVGVKVAKGEFILKTDAHVMFGEGFDVILARDCQKYWVMVPRRYALDPVRWEIEDNPKYPIDYMYLDNKLHGVEWRQKNKDKSLESKKIDELMSAQGSCWFMRKDFFNMLRLMDEREYGMFWNEFQEIGLKAWLYIGRVMVDKNTWYAHWHKTKSRGYSLDREDGKVAEGRMKLWYGNTAWVDQQRKPLSWLVDKFWPVPTWDRAYADKQVLDDEVMFWRKWTRGDRGKRHAASRPLIPEVQEMVGDRKEVWIADLGSSPVSMIGYTMEGVNVHYVPSDILADRYKEVLKFNGLNPPVLPEYQDMTSLTYKDESFDIVYCRNALDHSPDPLKALREMYRVCRKGGFIYLWHYEHVGKTMGYRNMHQWNIELQGGDVVFWSKDRKFMLSDVSAGFVNSQIPRKHKIVVSKLQK